MATTRRERRTNRRNATRLLRDRTRTNRARAHAARALATCDIATAKTHLIGRGLDPALAKRFTGAFSRGVQPAALAEARIKLRGRVRKTVTVKLYDAQTFAARLAVYRPKSPAAAAAFAALAA